MKITLNFYRTFFPVRTKLNQETTKQNYIKSKILIKIL